MKLRALVIDDSRVMRNLVMTTLRRTRLAEFDFTEAEDGADGLAKFDPKTTDIVFADWHMPNLTGVEFARHVREMKLEKRVPIVMITSERASAKMDEALGSAGADAYICKPFTADDMEHKLARVVAGIETTSPAPARLGGFFSNLSR